jgi:hypothetical protein
MEFIATSGGRDAMDPREGFFPVDRLTFHRGATQTAEPRNASAHVAGAISEFSFVPRGGNQIFEELHAMHGRIWAM